MDDPVFAYLRQASATPLLTAEEEQDQGRRIALGQLAAAHTLSLDWPLEDAGDSATLGMTVADERAAAPENLAEQRALREALELAMEGLDERERRVLELRYGLDRGQGRTLEEVGEAFGITRERIRQIEAEALRKLRHPRRGPGLRAFLEG